MLRIPSPLRQAAAALVFSSLVYTASTNGQTTNWVAFNDHTPGTTAGWSTAPWTTTYNMRGVAGGNAGTILSGNLTNIATGAQLPVIFTSTANGTPDDFGAMSYPMAGTPAYDLFNGKVDLGNAQSGMGIRASSGSTATHTYSNLDPSKKYVFRGAAIRGNNYVRRWTLCTLQSADSFTDAHTAGVYTSANFPSGTMTVGQAAFNVGENRTDGCVVGWDDIVPGADGTISILCQQYVDDPLPNGQTPDLTAYGYALCGEMLAEIETGPPFAPTNQNVNLPANANVPACANLVLTSSFQGSPAPTYLWFKNGAPMDTLANPSAATPSLALNNIQSGDAGTYHVQVSNGSGSAVSRDATVTVTVGAPHIASVTAMSSNANSFLFTFDVPVNAGSMDVFSISFASRNGLAGDLGQTATMAEQLSPTTVVVSSEQPRTPGVNYIANIITDAAVTDTCAGNSLVPTNINVFTEAALADFDNAADLWSYDQSGTDLGTAWTEMNYDDTAWPTGPAFFGLETTPAQVLGPIRTPWTVPTPLTFYLRKPANVPAPASQIVSLTLRQQVDDGSVTYVNGIEVDRHGFAAGGVVPSSSLAANEAEPQALITTSLGVTNVVEGRNVIAVEVHQSGTTSSDIVYGSKLMAVCRTVYPGLTIARSGSTATVSWSEYGEDGRLQTSTDLNSWVTDGRVPTNGGGTYSLTYTIPAGGGHLYIRLRP